MNFINFNLKKIKEYELFQQKLKSYLKQLCVMSNTINHKKYNTLKKCEETNNILEECIWRVEYEINEQNNSLIIYCYQYDDPDGYCVKLSYLTNEDDFKKLQLEYQKSLKEIEERRKIEENEKETLKILKEKYR